MINGIDEWCNLIVLTVYFELVINEGTVGSFPSVNNDDVSSFSNSVILRIRCCVMLFNVSFNLSYPQLLQMNEPVRPDS